MGHRHDTVSFLSDYGLSDEFVGVVKGVIRRLAPHVTVLDVCHEIPPHDVRAGALALARSVQYLPAGVVLAVVDPGVGTERRLVAVAAGPVGPGDTTGPVDAADDVGPVGPGDTTEEGPVFVGPDNGLLASA